MARDHARLQTAIWRNKEFRALNSSAQHLYFTIISQPTLSYCGVIDWWPNRLAVLSADGNEKEIYEAVSELIESDFVYVDQETSELLVRTYVKHDGVLQRTNMGKATARALEKVVSLGLQDLIRQELARLYVAQPTLAGWGGFDEVCPTDFEAIVAMASDVA